MVHVVFKVCFVGNPQSGKTTLINYLVGNPIDRCYIPTIGGQIHSYIINGQQYNIHDCVGPHTLGTPTSYKDGHIFFILKDGINDTISTKNCYKSIIQWKNEIRSICPFAQIHVLQNPSINQINSLL